ncbi:MAG: MATE family efflux transporter [Litorimonas sp.]
MAVHTNIDNSADFPNSWTAELSILLKLGIPMALAQLIQFSVYFFDTVMIARISPTDVAAAALGSVVYFMLWMIGSGPVAAISPLVSQALGKDKTDVKDPRRSVRMAIWAAFLMLPIVLICLCFTETVALKLGQDPEVARKAQGYVLALAIGLPFALATMALRNFLAALGKTNIPLVLVTLTTLINIALNYVLIFGNFGAPRLELVGAGIASSLSYIAGFFLFAAYIQWDKRAKTFDVFKRLHRPDWSRFKEIITLGWPISVTTIFEGMLFNAIVFITGILGVMEQAAYQIALNVASLAFMLPYGMSMAGSVRIGLARGANHKIAEKRAASTTLIACVLAIGLFALPIAIFPERISGLYLNPHKADDIIVAQFVIGFLPLAAGFMFFDALQVGANQLLRGLKDVKAPIWITAISYWVIGFPIAFYLALHTDIGVNGVWFGLMAGLFSAAIGLGTRLLWQISTPHHPPSY